MSVEETSFTSYNNFALYQTDNIYFVHIQFNFTIKILNKRKQFQSTTVLLKI
jgi:hypothetical protein